MSRSVHLHIERVVLDGLSPLDRDAVVAALRTELARLLTERGGLDHVDGDVRVARIDAGWVVVAHDADATQTGHTVARTVHAGLMR